MKEATTTLDVFQCTYPNLPESKIERIAQLFEEHSARYGHQSEFTMERFLEAKECGEAIDQIIAEPT